MIKNPYFEIVKTPKKMPVPDPDEILSGDFWGVKNSNGKYILNFVSGSHSGELKEIEIMETEFESLKSGEINIHDLLNSYHTG
jgi:hypothetical protein